MHEHCTSLYACKYRNTFRNVHSTSPCNHKSRIPMVMDYQGATEVCTCIRRYCMYGKCIHTYCTYVHRYVCNAHNFTEHNTTNHIHTVRTLKVLPEPLESIHVTHPTNLVPGLVGEPLGGWVGDLVLQTNSSGQEEHEL